MAIVQWRPKDEWDPFKDFGEHIHRDLGRLFDFPLTRWAERGDDLESVWHPAIDISEDKDNLIVKSDIPGLKQEDIDITIEGEMLTIKGEKKKESEVKGKDYHRVERVYGAFHRLISLPSTVDTNKVNATYKDGVLEITLPKTESAKPKQIKIQLN